MKNAVKIDMPSIRLLGIYAAALAPSHHVEKKKLLCVPVLCRSVGAAAETNELNVDATISRPK